MVEPHGKGRLGEEEPALDGEAAREAGHGCGGERCLRPPALAQPSRAGSTPASQPPALAQPPAQPPTHPMPDAAATRTMFLAQRRQPSTFISDSANINGWDFQRRGRESIIPARLTTRHELRSGPRTP